MRTSALELCRREKLFFPGCRVVCAVSGGPDSVALLLFLFECRQLLGIETLACAHYDHGLRGGESRRDAEFTRDLAGRLGLPFFLGQGDVAAQARAWGKGLEETGREMRYAFLEGLEHFDRIATAHTGDDNLETVLLRLVRGAGLRGLCGIPPRRGRIVRPLLETSREQVLEFLRRRGQPYCRDSSNESDDFARNRLRHRVLPALKEENPDLTALLGRNLSLLREDAAFLEEQAARSAEALVERHGGAVSASREALLALPGALRLRGVGEMARAVTPHALSARQLRAVEALLEGEAPSGTADLPSARALRRYERLELRPRTAAAGLEPQRLSPGTTVFSHEGNWIISCEIVKKDEEILHSVHTFTINYDIIKGDLVLRGRRPRDRIRLRGRPGNRLLSDLMIDKKIPRSDRDLIPVLADDSGVLAVYGFGVREDAVPGPGHPALRIRIQKNTKEDADNE